MRFTAPRFLVSALGAGLFLAAISAPLLVSADEFDDVLSARISELGIRGAAIAYFDKNTMAQPITRGYGRRSASGSSGMVTPDTAFMIASVSKPFVAAAVALLIEQGILSSLDDDICNVIPQDYDNPERMCRHPRHPDTPITWRMLVTHRSSIKRTLPGVENAEGEYVEAFTGPSGSWYAEDSGNPTCPLDDVRGFYRALLDPEAPPTSVGSGVRMPGGGPINWFEAAEAEGGTWDNAEPGIRYEYSNAAYGYLPALVEMALGEGQSFAEFSRDNLFEPLGMDATAWFRRDLPEDTPLAVPVRRKTNGDFRDIGHYCYIEYGSGALHTTANDLARFSSAIVDGYGTTTSTPLWSAEMGREYVSCQDLDDCDTGYAWSILGNSMKSRRNLRERELRGNDLEGRRKLENRRHLEEEDDDDDDFSSSATGAPSSESSSSSSSESSGGPWWVEEGFSEYDWTDGVWHDGLDDGVRTNLIILPKAGVYVAVLLNSVDRDNAEDAWELTTTIMREAAATLPTSSLSRLSFEDKLIPVDSNEQPEESLSSGAFRFGMAPSMSFAWMGSAVLLLVFLL